MSTEGTPHPDYPGLGIRAKEGDEVVRRDFPAVPPTYADGRPIQLYDRVRVVMPSPSPYAERAEPMTVTELQIRCWGKPGREQTWAGSRRDGPGDRWYDSNTEQVWISCDGMNVVFRADELERVID